MLPLPKTYFTEEYCYYKLYISYIGLQPPNNITSYNHMGHDLVLQYLEDLNVYREEINIKKFLDRVPVDLLTSINYWC